MVSAGTDPSFIDVKALRRYGSLSPSSRATDVSNVADDADSDVASSAIKPPQELLLTPISEIDLDESIVIFVSNQTSSDGCADTADNAKLFMLLEGVERIQKSLAPGVSAVYLWVDSLCLPGVANTSISSSEQPDLHSLPAYLHIFDVVDIMLTVIHDPEASLVNSASPNTTE